MNNQMKKNTEIRLKACIFDFDGVIVDSEKYHHRAWQRIAAELGVEFTYEEYRPFMSSGRQTIIPYLFGKAGRIATERDFAEYSRIREKYAAVELSAITTENIMPGIIDCIKRLKDQGIKCAVASASTASHIVAQRLQLYDLFDLFVDGEAQLPRKPQPDIFLHTAKLLVVQPSECVVFEDSANGILAAIRAGMHIIGVRASFTPPMPVINDFENLSLQRMIQLCTIK